MDVRGDEVAYRGEVRRARAQSRALTLAFDTSGLQGRPLQSHRPHGTERHHLHAGRRERRVLAVRLLVLLHEGADRHVDVPGVDRPSGHLDVELVHLHAEPHVDGPLQPHAPGLESLARERGQDARLEVRVEGVDGPDAVGVEGRPPQHRPLLVEHEVCRQHAERREDPGIVRHVRRPGADLAREKRGVHGAGAPVGEDGELARVQASLHGDLAHQVRHLRARDLDDRSRDLDGGHAEPPSECVQRGRRRSSVDPDLAAERKVGVEIAESEVRVGHRRLGPATLVRHGARVGACAARADPEAASVVDPRDAAAAGADRLHVDLRHEVGVLVDDRAGIHLDAIGEHETDVERGAADVGTDDVPDAEHACEVPSAEHPARRSRVERENGPAADGLHRADAAVGLHHEQRARQAK